MGEISATYWVLKALLVAPGTMATLAKLTDPERRAVAGPSGLIADDLSTILDNEADSILLVEACFRLATGLLVELERRSSFL